MRGLLVERDRRHRGSDPMMGKEYNQRLQQILTPEQYNKLTELRQQKRLQRQPQNPTTNEGKNSKPSPQQKDDDE